MLCSENRTIMERTPGVITVKMVKKAVSHRHRSRHKTRLVTSITAIKIFCGWEGEYKKRRQVVEEVL